MNKKILVTGGDGFIGKPLIKALIARGFFVRSTSRLEQSNADNKTKNTEKYECYKFDLNSEVNYAELLSNISVIIHLAGKAHSTCSAMEYDRVNTLGTKRLVEAAEKHGIKRFIFLSTIKVNGEKNMILKDGEILPFKEDNEPRPVGGYAVSKFDAEKIIQGVCASSEMDFVILRPTLVYGPGVKANFLSLIDAVNRKYPLPFGSLRNKRSFLYIDNLIQAIVLSIDYPKKINQVFLIGEEGITIPQLVRKIGNLLEKNVFLFNVPLSVLNFLGNITGNQKKMGRITDSLLVSTNSIREYLNWEPIHQYDEGLKKTINWYVNK